MHRCVPKILLLAGLAASGHAQNSLIPLADRIEHAFNPAEGILYITTERRTVERYDLVADPQALLSTGLVHVYDSAGNRTQTAYTLGSREQGSWDVAATRAGSALVTGSHEFFDRTLLRSLDLGGLGFSSDGRTTTEESSLFRSADGGTVLLIQSIFNGGYSVFDADTAACTAFASPSNSVENRHAGVSRDGSLIAIEQNGVQLFDRDLNPLGLISGFDGGIGFSPTRDAVYLGDTETDEIVAVDPFTLDEIERFALPDDLRPRDDSNEFDGAMSFSGDGRTLFVTTANGISVVAIPAPGSLAALGLSVLGVRRRR